MKVFFLTLFSHFLAFAAANFSDFDPYQEKLTKLQIEERLGFFLQKDANVGSYFSLTDEKFTLYDAPETQTGRRINYELKLALVKKEGRIKEKKHSLIGVKIAIDPGHLGGPYARLEERFIDIPSSIERKEPIQFDEGSLSFLTAKYLKILLEKEGAIVMLTRNSIGKSVYEEDFFDWLKKIPSFGREKLL